MNVRKQRPETAKGSSDWFTGDVFVDSIRTPTDASKLLASHVHFVPGARTAWHTHPKGQTLYVTDGVGFIGRRGGSAEEIRPGDVVEIDPGEEHWHGATPSNFMAHIALNEVDAEGTPATWGDQVTDEEYRTVL
jgi:quercetin dioxygenase-like cupin family protein